ncbi:MAG: hypothetical protein AAGM22_23265 [Acidobacteriota bacterium]
MTRFMAACLFFVLLVLAGCAGGGGLQLLPSSRTAEAELWELPADAFPSQRLYRVNYQGPEGKASFKLTLYVVAEGHYRMEAADTLGRRAWSLGVEPGREAVFLDHRNELYCTASGGAEQSFLPIAHLPLGQLPQLILGRIPARPATELAQGEGKVSFKDASGQLWNAEAVGGELSWWSLIQDGEAVAWWRRMDERRVFSDRRGGQQVTWREQVRERLVRDLLPLKTPDDYREGACGGAMASNG